MSFQYTSEQEAVILSGEGHGRVAAVAGSGKTTTLVTRIIGLLLQGANPERVMILMFNKKAQEDFEKRLAYQCKKFGFETAPKVQTFHSYGMTLCNAMMEEAVLPKMRFIFKEYEKDNLAKAELKKTAEIVAKQAPTGREAVKEFIEFIDLVKTDLVSPETVFERERMRSGLKHFIAAYKNFEKARKAKKVRFFSDYIRDPVKQLLKDDEARRLFSDRYDHIIVDEYQDINEVQQAMVRIIAGQRANVMVVGDADQCIYEWRGARPQYITELFEQDFNPCETYKLSYTFRNGHAISLAANSLIEHNVNRFDQFCLSDESTPQTQLKTHVARPGLHSSIINNWTQRGGELSQLAILVRLYSMAANVEFDLLGHQIPYRMEGSDRSLLFDPLLEGMLNFVRLSQGRLETADYDELSDRVHSMIFVASIPMVRDVRQVLVSNIARNTSMGAEILRDQSKYTHSQNLIDELRVRSKLWSDLVSNKLKPSRVIREAFEQLRLRRTFDGLYLRKERSREKVLLIERLIQLAEQLEAVGENFVDFMERCRKEVDANKGKRNVVTITTIHKAKGAEWPVVIIPDLEEGLFPYYDGSAREEEIEAERRAAYVAFTRAEHELHLIHPADEGVVDNLEKGSTNTTKVRPGGVSRFLLEANVGMAQRTAAAIYSGRASQLAFENGTIAQKYVQKIGAGHVSVSSELSEKDKRRLVKPKGWEEGNRIQVASFGEGTVTRVEEDQGRLILHAFMKERGEEMALMVGGNFDIRRIEEVD